MTNKLDDGALDRLFRAARTHNAWTEQPVREHQLRELYDLMKFGPTSGNCCPARFVWVRTADAKSRLAALAAPNNAPKILAAPVTVIVGYDLDFAEQLPRLFPARGKDMQAYYSDPLIAQTTAFRNSSLQGAYEPKKVEVSARAHYLWNSANNDPFVGFGISNAQAGQAFHINDATSYEVHRNVRLGFNGYWLQQLSDHEFSGVAVPNSRERTVGLGPGIQLSGRDLWFRLNGYIETDVHNRPSGIKVTFRITKAMPARGN